MFDRLELIIGDKINLLKTKSVLLIGLGGVGGHTFESLVRSGIGTIIIIDNDTFDTTNLNRQLLALNNNIGQLKVDVAEERKNQINPECQIIKINEFITKDNLEEIFKNKIDFLIDAEDTLPTKKLIIKECLKRQIKFISVMGTGNKMDASKLEILDIKNTSYDPIAREIRHFLKTENINGKVIVVASKEEPVKNNKVGSNAFVPATAGLLATSFAINELLKEN